MLLHRPTQKVFHTRKEAKDFLGGTNKYNRALKNKDFYFINEMSIAFNDSVHSNYEGYYQD
jgi:hypothetical protein